MKNLSNVEAELKRSIPYEKRSPFYRFNTSENIKIKKLIKF